MVFRIHNEWLKRISSEFSQEYFKTLIRFLKIEYRETTVFPKEADIFRALTVHPDRIKVVILGQDPYHGQGQAHGYSFSVPTGIPLPPSLRNIYKELETDTGDVNLGDGDLTPWVNQGVMLLNRVLTVEADKAGSHSGWGWESFTDKVISELSSGGKPKVFILWGNKAQEVLPLIDANRNRVICSAHPSPLSASKGFFGSKPFSKCNRALKELGHEPIRWLLNKEI